MALRHTGDGTTVREEQSGTLKRRGLIAGAAGLVAGILAAKATENVSAANGDPLQIGNTATIGAQLATATTTLGANLTTAPVMRIVNGFNGSPDAKQELAGYAQRAAGTGFLQGRLRQPTLHEEF